MNYNATLGLHIRLNESVLDAIRMASVLKLPIFQFFLSNNQLGKENKYFAPTNEEFAEFLALKQHFREIYIHTSYWINASSGKDSSAQAAEQLLKKEIKIAKQLGVSKLVLHPGSATHYAHTLSPLENKMAGIERLSNQLNTILAAEPSITIILENTAHGNKTIGSDLQDFILIKERMHYPNNIRFCIDFAHAFAYGYDLADTNTFVALLDSTIGLQALELIHFNDSQEPFGEKKDKHAYPGYGRIGKKTLKTLLYHPQLQAINKILELPQSSTLLPADVIKDLASW